MNSDFVSVVIPAYNCSSTIAQCIQSILDQTVPNVELIVVDDGSTDQTLQIIKSYSNVICITQKNSGPAIARNVGFKQAKGQIVFFTDSDCIAQSDWVKRALPHFQDSQVGAVCGSYGIANPKSRLARCVHQEVQYRHAKLMPTYPKSFGSYNVAVRKDVFGQLGGFNESYRRASGEDNDLSYRLLALGYRIYFEPRALVDHFHPTSARKYLSEQFRHGFWRVYMYRAHPQMMVGDDYTYWKDIVEVPIVLLIFGLALMCIFLGDPWALLVLVPIIGLLLIEIVSVCSSVRRWPDRLYYSVILFFRAIARTLGFVSGAVYFLPGIQTKKDK